MNWFLWTLLGLFLWTAASIAYFISQLGNKHPKYPIPLRKQIIDTVLGPPALCVCYLIGRINRK